MPASASGLVGWVRVWTAQRSSPSDFGKTAGSCRSFAHLWPAAWKQKRNLQRLAPVTNCVQFFAMAAVKTFRIKFLLSTVAILLAGIGVAQVRPRGGRGFWGAEDGPVVRT